MPEITNQQSLIDGFVSLMPPRTAPAAKAVSLGNAPAEVVNKLLQAAQGESLWDGVWDYEDNIFGRPYTSQSEADFALLGSIVRRAHSVGVPENMVADAAIRVFEQSGLYRPDKRHRVLTQDIPNLIASHYSSAPSGHQNIAGGAVNNVPRLASGRINFSNTTPPPRDYVLEELILAKKVCLLGGLGGVSKTIWLMMLAVSIVLGEKFLGKQTKMGSVLLILGEEDQEEIDRRFNAICSHLKLDQHQIHLVDERLRAYPMNGLDARFTKTTGGSLEGTEFPDEIITAAKVLVDDSGLPLALLGLDHAGRIHGGEFNSREDVVQTMMQAEHVAKDLEVATLVLAHSPKTSIGKEESDQNDVTGSAAWVDLARAAFVLRVMSEAEAKKLGISSTARGSYVSFTVVKNNYGPTGDKLWLMRDTVHGYGVSVLNHVTLSKPQPANKSSQLNSLVKAFVGRHPGQYSKTALRDTQGGTSGPFKVGKNQVAATIEDLLASGEMQLVKPTVEQRKKFGLKAQVEQVLEAAP